MHGTLPAIKKLSWRERLFGTTRPSPQAGFLRDMNSPQFFGWNPALREPKDEYCRANYEVVRRTIDAIHNSGWLAGGVEQAATQMVGPMLALNARPDPELFGNATDAAAWARRVEGRFSVWAKAPYACDFTGQQNLGQMCSQAIKGWFGYGEVLGLIQYDQRPGNELGTKLQLLPPTRMPLSAKNMKANQGILLDGKGRPERYCITQPRKNDYESDGEIEVQGRDETGRVVLVHIHDSPPTVLRGISPLAPALQVVRQFDQLANATLTSALIQAIFTATIESDAPTDQLLAALQDPNEQDASSEEANSLTALLDAKASWYDRTKIDLGTFGKVVHLFVGEKLNFKRSESPNSEYVAYSRHLLLEIARCLGITYEQLTGDWREATYTSGRMGAAENWLTNLYRRQTLAVPLMNAVYATWLEEEIERGLTPFPGGVDNFIANRDRAMVADWRGPPKPSADDYKTSKANETKLANKIITREMWCADEGVDYDEVFEQLAQEEARADELGIDLTPQPALDSPNGGTAPADAAPNAEDNVK